MSMCLASWTKTKRIGSILFLMTFIALNLNGQQQTVTLISGTSWIAPQGVYSITVECWGAGGGGGGVNHTGISGTVRGSGGGGGGFSSRVFNVTPGNSYSYSVGVAGAGGTTGGTAGSAGGSSTFTVGGTTITANGGAGGAGRNGTSGAGTPGGAGGTGTGGTTNYSGGNGGNAGGNGAGGGGGAGSGSNGTNGANAATGAGGTGNPNGAGGAFRTTNGNGNQALLFGGGGGGARAGVLGSRAGGAGAPGMIRISFCVAPASVNAGVDNTICSGSSTNLNGSITENTTLFSENFEGTAADYYIYGPWSNYEVITGGYSDWYYTDLTPISGSRSLTLYDSWGGFDNDYDWGGSSEDIAYTTIPINATGYSGLELNFDWICEGEAGFDYGMVVWSTNATTWNNVSATQYQGQSTTQSVTNLDLSAADGTVFYLGFRWQNDASIGTSPGFMVDNIVITGTPTKSYAWSPGTSLSSTTIANPSANPSATITYTLTGTQAACASPNTDAVVINVDPASVAPTSISGPTNACHGNVVSLSQSGGSLSTGASYEWFSGSCGGTALGTGTSITVNPSSTTNYFVRASAGTYCPATTCANSTITLPSVGTTLANDAESATCVVNQNGFVHFYHSSGRLLASINSYGQDLGSVDVTAYVGSAANIPACNYPTYESAFMGRRYAIIPTNQPSSGVDVILHFDNSEFSSLVSTANANSTGDDDLTTIGDLAISKYSGPNNVDGNAANNCPGAGGNGGSTLHAQTSNGNSSTLHAGFSSTGRYVEVNVSSFSEFWFGGNGITPLATELIQFSASCTDANSVMIKWSTASEQNCAQYILKKSTDGNLWETIGNRSCSSNSNSLKNYEFEENTRNNGLTYYQLAEIDHNGIETALKTISISCSNNEMMEAIVYPNPASNEFSLEVNSSKELDNVTVSLLDIQGKLITQTMIQFENGTTVVPFEGLNLDAGSYFLHLEGVENQLKPIKVVIQK